jgi:hypothetical protein
MAIKLPLPIFKRGEDGPWEKLRDFTQTQDGPYDDDLPFEEWLEDQEQLPPDAWPPGKS